MFTQSGVLDELKESDAETQLQLFRSLLRSALDPQRLAPECEKFLAEFGPKKETRKDRGSSLEERGRAGSKTQEPTQTITPSLESKPYDLKTVIEQRIREARLARQREKEA